MDWLQMASKPKELEKKPGMSHTEWEFTNFSATQILREINVSKFRVSKTAILTISEVLGF